MFCFRSKALVAASKEVCRAGKYNKSALLLRYKVDATTLNVKI